MLVTVFPSTTCLITVVSTPSAPTVGVIICDAEVLVNVVRDAGIGALVLVKFPVITITELIT